MDEKKIATEGFPSVYANHASVSMSAVDIRVYFSEITPKELNVEIQDAMKPAEAIVNPRIGLVMTPEFARTVLETLTVSIAQYESRFGALRANPNPPPQVPSLKK